MRWTAATSVFIGFGLAAWGAVGHISTGNPKLSQANPHSVWRASLTPALGQGVEEAGGRTAYLFSRSTTFSAERAALAEQPAVRTDRLALAVNANGGANGGANDGAGDPFDAVVKNANLSSEKLAKAFRRGKPSVQVALAQPSAERFGGASSSASRHLPAMALAYAAPGETRAAQALHVLADEEDSSRDDFASLPGEMEIPDSAPIPTLRPASPAKPAREAAIEEKASDPKQDAIRVVPPSRPAAQPLARDNDDNKPALEKPRRRLATARENEPGAEKLNGGLGWSFRNIFSGSGGARAGNGVAVYDISAAKVYMPDGSILEAHSGIGKMADNPKYVNVKMNGPTPPHTYNLRMRETRFHGVEAIRMLPVDGKNKHGRDGFLTHSYLLRGRIAQSHGCVAFKDYEKFLTAYKKGKVKQMVVVSSGGRAAATRLASN